VRGAIRLIDLAGGSEDRKRSSYEAVLAATRRQEEKDLVIEAMKKAGVYREPGPPADTPSTNLTKDAEELLPQ